MNKKIITNTILVLLVLIISSIVYLSNFRLILFDADFYEEEFEKHGVYDKFGKEQVDEINSGLLAYFKDDETDFIETDFFGLDEKEHLLDVKIVVQTASSLLGAMAGFAVFLLILLYLLIGKHILRHFSLILVFSGLVTLLFAAFLFLSFTLSFDTSFTVMHNLFFEKGTWMFPEGSNLTAVYPAGFFYHFSRALFSNAIIHSFVLVLLGFVVRLVLFEKILKKKNYIKDINKK